jgi:flagellar basal body L-ring protein FlgH
MRLFAAAMAALFALGMFSVGSTVSARTIQVPVRTSAQAQHAVQVITVSHKKKKAKKKKHHKSSGPKLYAVGKAMTNGAHQTVTVTAFTQAVAASEFSTPSPGDQCVSVQVAVFNGDSSPWDLPLDELTVVDASGRSYDSYSSFDCPSSDSIDSLVPGGRAPATLYFEVPLSGKLLLQWTPSILNPTSVYNTELKTS